MTKAYCELIITSETVTPDKISESLGLLPTRIFLKGEKSISKSSGSIITKPHNLWAFKSEEVLSDNQSISKQLIFLKSIFADKMEAIKSLKSDNDKELTFWIWMETEDGGLGLDLNESETNFINSISNTLHFTVVSNIKR